MPNAKPKGKANLNTLPSLYGGKKEDDKKNGGKKEEKKGGKKEDDKKNGGKKNVDQKKRSVQKGGCGCGNIIL